MILLIWASICTYIQGFSAGKFGGLGQIFNSGPYYSGGGGVPDISKKRFKNIFTDNDEFELRLKKIFKYL